MIFKPHKVDWKLRPNINLKVQLKIQDTSHLNNDKSKESNKDLILEDALSNENTAICENPVKVKDIENELSSKADEQIVNNLPCDFIDTENKYKHEQKNIDDKSNEEISDAQGIVVDGNELNPNLEQYIKEDPIVYRDAEYENLAGNYSNWHLRKNRADIFLSKNAQEDFISALLEFLKKKQLKVLPFDNQVHYLPSDILLLSDTVSVEQGSVFYLSKGKRALWHFLKCELGDRVQK